MIRSISEIGAMWPRCKTCRHEAQAHDFDAGEVIPKGSEACCEIVTGQCKCCGTQGIKVKCPCNGYDGPTWEEFKTLLTPEEIAYYHYEGDRK